MSNPSTRKLAFLAMLTALAVAGRFAFSSIPNVQPATAIIIISALILGVIPGITIACMSALITNLYLGTGIWTIWQMLSWSVIALLFGLLAERRIPVWTMTILAVISGYLYGFVISIPNGIIAGHFWSYYLAGLLFDTAHAIGNGIFFAVLYPVLTRTFRLAVK